MAEHSPAPPGPSDPDRLNGWKEIASYLGKGVRTAQRWEKEYQLPVRRLGRPGGEIIIASRRELDAWLKGSASITALGGKSPDAATSAAPTSAAPVDAAAHADAAATADAEATAHAPAPVDSSHAAARRPDARVGSTSDAASAGTGTGFARARRPLSWFTRIAASLGLLLLGASIGWQLARMAAAARERVVVAARVENGRLVGYDGVGRAVWRKSDFGFALRDEDYDPRRMMGYLTVEDLDADGVPEIIIAARSGDRHPMAATYVLENNGSTRAVIRPNQHVSFGTDQFTGPWLPHRVFVVRSADGPHVYASFVDGSLFPTMVLSLGATGEVLGEFWSDGYVNVIALGERGGHPRLYLGATNNETRGATVAVFDTTTPTGSMPAVNERYRCTGCPPGGPLATVVFPPRDITAGLNGTMAVEKLFQDGQGGFRVLVSEGTRHLDGTLSGAVWYHLDPSFTLTRIEVTTGAIEDHRVWRQKGVLDHDYGPRDREDLVPVRSWAEGAWRPVPLADTLERLAHFPDEREPWHRP
ncbi:MAG: helix-turn-helix domain-containing protein [Vicinamibacterales bacterium]